MPFIITIDQQKAYINAALNSTLIFLFFQGIYTGVFAVTIYIHAKGYQNRSYNKVMAASVVVLFLIAWTEMVISWDLTNIAFCKQATTRASIYLANLRGLSGAFQIVGGVGSLVGFVLADSLLVWRCFHANGGRLGGIFLLPMMLLVVETLLAITTMILESLLNAKPGFDNVQTARIDDQMVGATFGFIAATSVTSTVIICKNIYTHTRHNHRARKRVVYVVDILTQSCAIYTVVAVGQAITSFLDTGAISNFTTLKILIVESYISALTYIVMGLVPTLMVARLATASPGTESTSTEPTSLASLPPELKDHSHPERASIGADRVQVDGTYSASEEVDQDDSAIVEETRDKHRVRSDEENCA
ncbi:hypothetical protein CPC08DRAFT_712337 [Agrocybe pediades]|nr:hypothetical protein CPC08DRAFT_712337 [Agrocybe pediades]